MKDYKLMIVDDERDILDLLARALNIEGFKNIIKIDNGISAIASCLEQQPDIIILDVMLPDMDGYEVCKQIRQFSHCPILFLSSKNDELDKILGLAVGGDDYVTKPFSPKEVAYRIKAQLRRMGYTEEASKPHWLQIGSLIIDGEGCRVTKNNQPVELTAREFEILYYLAQNKGRVISRERLYEAIWSEDSFGCDNTIMVHISHLREKIEDDPNDPQYILTMKGLGYKLVEPHEKAK
ncbi:response regulator transcription factor [Dielma fastidiosa]|uniref:DNA-binding response OmpR family regulator n=1 Tax=Dielma fastidiosa TaxID=1034346 RepID=A0A318KTC7_9FIRM|nr:response regulator transcription factor [Dielma fastidiosa]PXX78936.1 DNA-binding response OmpR family regulator [Dielma fastidiosa]